MNRVQHHHISLATLLRTGFDLALVLLVTFGGVALQSKGFAFDLSMPGAHAASLAVGLFVINSAAGFYDPPQGRSWRQSFARATFALLLALPLTFALFSLLPAGFANRDAFQWSCMSAMTVVILRRVYVTHWATQPRARLRILIFGSGSAAAVVGQTLKESDPNLHIVGYVPGPNERDSAVPAADLITSGRALNETARELGVDEIVVALTERRAGSMPLRQLLDCKLFGIKVYDISTHFEKALGLIRIDYLNAGWLIFGDGFNQGAYRTAIKRAFDLFCALLLFVVSAPVMLLAALLIKLESRGPIFYRQQRVGVNGSSFDVIKFRSMSNDAEKDGKPRWATTNDDRVTRVGRIIRRMRIDELPQLLNVLKGEMSLVGPRPERPYFVDQLTQEIPYFAVRHSVKPGVTGWAQVRYQYGATVEDAKAKLQYDLYYVKNHSLFLDLVILFETVSVVLTGKGAR